MNNEKQSVIKKIDAFILKGTYKKGKYTRIKKTVEKTLKKTLKNIKKEKVSIDCGKGKYKVSIRKVSI